MIKYKQEQRRPKKVVNKEERSEKNKPKKKSSTSKGFYYSFLTVILFLCLIQITVSAVLNVSKVVSYNAKIMQITKTRDAALALNAQLKDNINNLCALSYLSAFSESVCKGSIFREIRRKNENSVDF